MASLDQIVKGAPTPGKEFDIPTTTSPIIKPGIDNPSALSDPLASLPSSPPQIYLNLLILEASLRAQWLQLRTRRRQHAFFLTLLALWVSYFMYALFLKPREDGNGVGGSVYWVVEVAERVCCLGGLVTGLLVWGTGQWERGVRWPRRWVYSTNRGLRGFNCKLVVIKQSWWRDVLSTLRFIFSYSLWSSRNWTSYRYVDQSILREAEKAQRSGTHHALPNIQEDHGSAGYEEDIAPGGDYVKLLLLPKPFSPKFRENWDIYRTEYWERENERRAILRRKLKERDRRIAKGQGGWLWWTGYRGWQRGTSHDIEKTHHHLPRLLSEKDPKRVRSGSVRSGSHSRTSSRSTTPTLEGEDRPTGHVRRGSSASTTSDRRRKKSAVPDTTARKLTPGGARSISPGMSSPLVRESSFTSISSLDTDDTENELKEVAEPRVKSPERSLSKGKDSSPLKES